MFRITTALTLVIALPAAAQQVTDAIDPEIAAAGATFGP